MYNLPQILLKLLLNSLHFAIFYRLEVFVKLSCRDGFLSHQFGFFTGKFFLFFRCTAINFLMKRMPLQWVIEHQLSFINALCFVMMDLTNEVS